MNITEFKIKIELLKKMINEANENNNFGDVFALLNLTAKAELSLRNNTFQNNTELEKELIKTTSKHT